MSTLDVVSKLGRASATVEESHEVKKLCKGEVPYEKASVSGWMPLRCRETVRRVSEVRNRALARLKHFPPTPHPTPPPGFTIDWVVLRFAEVPLMLRCRCCRLRGRRAQPELEDRRPIEPQRAAVKAAFAFSQPTADSLSHAPQLGSWISRCYPMSVGVGHGPWPSQAAFGLLPEAKLRKRTGQL